jgi:hypothetical protein
VFLEVVSDVLQLFPHPGPFAQGMPAARAIRPGPGAR